MVKTGGNWKNNENADSLVEHALWVIGHVSIREQN